MWQLLPRLARKAGIDGRRRDAAWISPPHHSGSLPVELWNRTFRAIAAAEGLTLAEEARLFAMLNIASADGFISCWDDKWYWSFWRPVTAIRLGNDDPNPKTVGDPAWTSKIASPPYPDHPSGYNCVTGSFMYTARDFFDTNKIRARPAPGTLDAALAHALQNVSTRSAVTSTRTASQSQKAASPS